MPTTLDDAIAVASDRWFMRADLSTLSTTLVVVLAVLGLALAIWPRSWAIAGHAVTAVHEIGHALAALSVGRITSGIVLRADMSGETQTHGAGGRLRTAWTTWWGYPAPAVAGAGLTVAATSGYSGAALVVAGALLGISVLLSRSLVTLFVLAVSTAATVAVLIYASPTVLVTITYALGWFLLVGSLRGLSAVTKAHFPGSENRDSSDAAALAHTLFIPSVIWLATFLAATIACFLVAASSIVGSL